jgi:transcriptional regulator with XRE-family HTH domain
METILQMFSEIFSKTMDDADVSSYRLTKETGIDNGLISKWRKGASVPSAEMLVKLADYFDVSVDYLLGRTDAAAKGIEQKNNDSKELRKVGNSIMGRVIEADNREQTIKKRISVDEPAECPMCHVKATPVLLQATIFWGVEMLCAVSYECSGCHKPYIACYKVRDILDEEVKSNLLYIGPVLQREVEVSPELQTISPRFRNVYAQAMFAQEQGLMEIAGPGYRKALEILIRDYITHNKPETFGKLNKTYLRNCINDHLPSEFKQLKQIASDCASLGNDEIHYYREYRQNDIKDLAELLNSAFKLIESLLTAELISDRMTSEKGEGKTEVI